MLKLVDENGKHIFVLEWINKFKSLSSFTQGSSFLGLSLFLATIFASCSGGLGAIQALYGLVFLIVIIALAIVGVIRIINSLEERL